MHCTLLFTGRANHKARRVTEGQHRNRKAIAQGNKARSLVSCFGINGTAQHLAIIGNQAHSAPLDTNKARNNALPMGLGQLLKAVCICKLNNNLFDIIGVASIGGHHRQ